MGQSFCQPAAKSKYAEPVEAEKLRLHELIDSIIFKQRVILKSSSQNQSIVGGSNSSNSKEDRSLQAAAHRKEKKQLKEQYRQLFHRLTGLIGKNALASLISNDEEVVKQVILDNSKIDFIREWLILHPESFERLLKDPKFEPSIKMRDQIYSRSSVKEHILSTAQISRTPGKSEISLASVQPDFKTHAVSSKDLPKRQMGRHINSTHDEIGATRSTVLLQIQQQSVPALPDWVLQEQMQHKSKFSISQSADEKESIMLTPKSILKTSLPSQKPSMSSTHLSPNKSGRSVLRSSSSPDYADMLLESIEVFDALVTDTMSHIVPMQFDAMIERQLERFARSLNAESVSVLLLNEQGDVLTKRCTVILEQKKADASPNISRNREISSLESRNRYSFKSEAVSIALSVTSVLTKVTQSGEPLNLTDPSRFKSWNKEIDSYRENATIQNMLIFPIFQDKTSRIIIGVLAAYNKSPGSDAGETIQSIKFSVSDELFLQHTLLWAAVTLVNHKRFDTIAQRIQMMEIIFSFYHDLVSQDSCSTLLELLLKLMASLTNSDHCTIYLTDELQNNLSAIASFHASAFHLHMDLNSETIGPSTLSLDSNSQVKKIIVSGEPYIGSGLTELHRTNVRSNSTANGLPTNGENLSKSEMVFPLVGQTKTIGLICIKDKKPKNNETTYGEFTDDDTLAARLLISSIGVIIEKVTWMDKIAAFTNRESDILNAALNIFSESDYTQMIKGIKRLIAQITSGTEVRLFLCEKEHDVLRLWPETLDAKHLLQQKRMPISQGIVGWVVTSGESVNILDMAYHPKFSPEMDDPSFKAESSGPNELQSKQNTDSSAKTWSKCPLMYIPIKRLNDVVGVIQVTKAAKEEFGAASSQSSFTKEEQDQLETLASFLAFHYHKFCLEEEAVLKSLKYNQANRILCIERHPAEEEVAQLSKIEIPPAENDLFCGLASVKFYFIPHGTQTGGSLVDTYKNESIITQIILRMFLDLDFSRTYDIPYDRLCRFALFFCKSFKRHPFRNIYHTLNSAQFVYYFLSVCHFDKMEWMTELEAFALFLAALCRDLTFPSLEHRFHGVIDGAYAGLESNIENMTYDVIAHLFHDESTNILSGLSTEEHAKLLEMIKILLSKSDLLGVFDTIHHIAAIHVTSANFKMLTSTTQLPRAHQHKKRSRLSVSSQDKKPFLELFSPKTNGTDRLHLFVLILACADCSLKWKVWTAVYQHAKLMMSELYAQSDLERKALGLDALANLMRDAERDIPLMEVKFIDTVAAPCLEFLKIILELANVGGVEEITDLLYRLLDNRRRWEEKMPTYDDRASVDSIRGRELK